MSKVYTAYELIDRADYERKVNGNPIATAMLRQAANALEREEKREKKFEFRLHHRIKHKNGKTNGWVFDGVYTDSENLKWHVDFNARWALGNKKSVEQRVEVREVGEWEEVLDGE